jgi:hypothetical protein
MSKSRDDFSPDRRVFWYLSMVARTAGKPHGRSDNEIMAAAAFGYDWLRRRPISRDAWAVALSQSEFDTAPEVEFRSWLQQAAVIVHDCIVATGPLDIPPPSNVPPGDATTGDPVGDPDGLQRYENVKHRVNERRFKMFLRVLVRKRSQESIDDIAQEYGMDPAELEEIYNATKRILEAEFER